MTHLVQDESRSLAFTLVTEVDGVAGTLDLTGVTEISFKMQSRSGVLTKLKTAGAIAIVGAATEGALTVALTRADTKSLTPGKQSAELIIDWGANVRRTFQMMEEFTVERVLFA